MSTNSYTLQSVQALVGISRNVMGAMLASRIVTPRRGPGNRYLFSFQDLLLFRTAHSLREANVPTGKIIRSLKRLEALAQGRPLTGIRVTALGGAVAMKDEHGSWHVESGQRIIDFDAPLRPSSVVALNSRSETTATFDGRTLFEIACELERDDPEEAELAYRKAIAADPGLVDAYVNLGCLLCERECFDEAVGLYRAALASGFDGPLIRFNLAVALEDAGDVEAALGEYHDCIRMAPDFADAHYNAARLYEAMGDDQGAIRHYHQYRKLDRR